MSYLRDQHMDRAISDSCPHMRSTCVMAWLGCCSAVEAWYSDRRAEVWSPYNATWRYPDAKE